ncbi:MAG TPA: glycosyltransferase [Saprospiraceae bacterium]|nr:glycosyltransferase [Saprospiraceae bacterium]
MEVSVIIPVYNAEKYLSQAIDSALAQEETLEVILVEDNSPDQSLKICQEYASRDQRILLLRHPDGENHGAGASFNWGIRHAHAEFVAFLGADDLYVSGAFKTARHIFEMHPDAHGTYAHIGVKYYDAGYKELHLRRVPGEISGMKEYIPPADLLSHLLKGKDGHISLDSVVLRREILTKQYLFDESLRLAQDTDFMYRLASAYRLYGPKERAIVALRGVHAGNRVFQFDEAAKYRQRVLRKCIRNNFYGCRDRSAVKRIIYRYLKPSGLSQLPFLPAGIKRRMAFLLFMSTHPSVVWYVLTLPSGEELTHADRQLKIEN